MGLLDSVLRRNKELKSMFDLDFTVDTNHRGYLKMYALETNINFIARTIAQSDFRFMENNKRLIDDWHYIFNVRPNTDQSAADFWQKFVYKLIYENEVLAILTDSDDLVIADSFEREESALYPDRFKDVTVKEYTYKRYFPMNEVIHINFNNAKLTRFMEGMFQDYAELFSRKIETSQRNNQIRGMVGLSSAQALDDKNLGKLQNFIDRMLQSFKSKAIAIVPKLKGFEYDEISNGEHDGQSIEELTKLKRSLIDDVANILGIPNALVHGELSDYETSIKAYVRFCNTPIVEKIEDELNAKIITKEEYLQGKRVTVYGITERNLIDNAEAVDKLVSSGSFTRNEVRELFGKERSDDPELDKFVITKNYQAAEAAKGGEKE